MCSQAKGSGIVAWEGRETNTSHSHTPITSGQKYIRTMSDSPPPWTERLDTAVRTLHPANAAQKLGVSVRVIKARRKQLKLPPVADQFTVSGGKGGFPGWTQEEMRIVIAGPPVKAKRLLPHRTLNAIHTLRTRLRQNGVKVARLRAPSAGLELRHGRKSVPVASGIRVHPAEASE